MKLLRILLLLLVPGCAGMDEFFASDDGDYFTPAATSGCPTIAPNGQPAPGAAYQPSPVQRAGYETKEPPM